jgi:hypothetical protein
MDIDDNAPRRGKLNRLAELGPLWISAITGLLAVLFGAGFLVGHTTGSPNPRPTVTITVPSTVKPDSTSPSTSPTGVQASANGHLLGSYTFRLGQYTSAPLGATAPTQAQILANSGDIVWNTGAGGAPLQPGTGEQIANLSNGSTPTYHACKTDTVFSVSASPNQGTAFCIIETTGRMAGVIVVSTNLSQQPYYLILHVAVWTNSS